MELIIRIAASALLAAMAALLLKRRTPELSVPLSATVCCFALLAASALLQGLL